MKHIQSHKFTEKTSVRFNNLFIHCNEIEISDSEIVEKAVRRSLYFIDNDKIVVSMTLHPNQRFQLKGEGYCKLILTGGGN